MGMRIGFDASKVVGPRDGIGTYTASLLSALAEVAGEHRLCLYPSLHPVPRSAIDGMLGDRARRITLADRPFPASGEVDLFHATSWLRPPSFTGPVLMTCYDLTVVSHPTAHRLDNRVHCLSGLLDASLAGDRFLTLSAATAEALRQHLEIPAARIHTVPAAVDERFSPRSDQEVEAVLAAHDVRAPFVLAVGTREPRKNLGRLLDAWRLVRARRPDTPPLVIAGTAGWGGHDDRTSDLESATGVRLLGHVDDEALPALYTAAAVLAFPSLAEGFGFPVLEAMACGAPVVTSSISSLPEVAGDAALLVDPYDVGAIADGLERALADGAEAERLRRAGRERAAAFTWTATADALLDLYAALAGGGKP